MANPIVHELTEANTRIKASAGFGKAFPIDRFTQKSLMLVVGGAGSYDVQVSNSGNEAIPGEWKTIASALVAGGSPNLITTEHGATSRFPDKVGFMRVKTNTFNIGDHGDFLGEDPG